MCGGLGTRMGGVEKPMLTAGGKRFVERVHAALAGSGSFSRIVAAVSPNNTPQTRKFLLQAGVIVEVIDTPGSGYSQDLSLLLSKLAPEKVMVVPVDLPLLNAEIIRKAVNKLLRSSLSHDDAPAVSIVVDKSFAESLGITPSVVVTGDKCHSGITLFDAGAAAVAAVRGEGGNKLIEERYVTMNEREIAMNVNTKEEKELAELLLVQHAQDLARDDGL